MSSGIFGIASSALIANQRALATVGNNIANAGTEGYSRQRVEFTQREPFFTGGGYIGNGADVTSVRRAYDAFVADQLTQAISGNARQDELAAYAGRLDDLLADPNSGLSPALDRFYNAWQDLANDPTSSAARATVLAESESLAARFRSIDQRLDEVQRSAETQIRTTVSEINSLATSLANINVEILGASGDIDRQPPNDLLDQRDQLVNELADRVGITTVARQNGTIDVFIGQGQALVLGSSSIELAAGETRTDPTAPDVTLVGPGGNIDVGRLISGGRLGGLIEFKERILDGTRNAVGRVAVGVVDTTNAAHRLGLDLDGRPGGDFFASLDAAPRVAAASFNSGTAAISARIVDPTGLTTSDYRLFRDGASYTLRRLDDGSLTDLTAAFSGGAPATVVVDGLELSLDAGALADGDQFIIEPTRAAAGAMDVLIGAGRSIAAAGLLRAEADPGNSGSAAIDQPLIRSGASLPLGAAGIELVFDAGSSAWQVVGGPGGTIPYDPVADAGGLAVDLAPDGLSFTLSGTPADGDRLLIADNAGGRGDNRAALAIAGGVQRTVLDGGNATVGDAYGALVAEVATRSREAQVASEVERARLESAEARRAAVSGVNLDEEAADLLRYQQAYQAAARVVSVADELFQTLLDAVR
ncbi:MAG: flagellar hook-associated protein FlgK [Pseudomonadales bacterium]|jgi:flagellar hook-associated protein 1 FlgK|nr:flagellar hook-associated protein FlgK [Pseudomonadales bacterium]